MSGLEIIPREIRANGKQAVVESDTTLAPARSLEAIAEAIRHEHDLVVRAGRRMLEHAAECGQALFEAKTRVGRGGWKTWVDQNVPFSYNTATFYIQITTHIDVLREHDIDGMNAARRFLIGYSLVQQDPTDDEVDQIRAMRDQGMSYKQIAQVTNRSISTVHAYATNKRKKPRRNRRKPVRDGRAGQAMHNSAISEDLIEGLAIWLAERNSVDVTDETRAEAVEALQAAFTYRGPIPSETA